MLILDKWTLRDTLALLSHPERKTEIRARRNKKEKSALQKEHEETQRLAYANAYKELQEEISRLRHKKEIDDYPSVFSIE
jgi:hypothetical protein